MRSGTSTRPWDSASSPCSLRPRRKHQPVPRAASQAGSPAAHPAKPSAGPPAGRDRLERVVRGVPPPQCGCCLTLHALHNLQRSALLTFGALMLSDVQHVQAVSRLFIFAFACMELNLFMALSSGAHFFVCICLALPWHYCNSCTVRQPSTSTIFAESSDRCALVEYALVLPMSHLLRC